MDSRSISTLALVIITLGIPVNSLLAANGTRSNIEALQQWLQAIEQHQVGTWDTPAQRIAARTDREIEGLTPTLETLFDLVRDPENPKVHVRKGMDRRTIEEIRPIARAARLQGGADVIHRRGALLHSDIMMFGPSPARRIPAGQARLSVFFGARVGIYGLDGQHDGLALMTVHWRFARFLLDWMRAGPASETFVRAWYRATTAFMLRSRHWGEAEQHLTHARTRLAGEASVHFDSGCLYETYADRSAQTMAAAARASGAKVDVQSPASNLRRAEGHFQDALSLEPSRAEARIRLARVRMLLGRPDAAVPELLSASADAPDSVVRYYASLFLGQAYETLGRPDRARAAYEEAAQLYPLSQPAHLALSVLALAAGDYEDARRAPRRFLSAPAAGRVDQDPWWSYHLGSGRSVGPLVLELWKLSGVGSP